MTSDARVGGTVLGDAELITAARGGDSSAFALLYERHAGAALVVARQYSTSKADAEDVVSEAFTKVFAVFQNGGGPDVAFRAYLFTVVRRLGMSRKDGLRRVEPTDDIETFESGLGLSEATDAPAMADFERNVVARAYATLPERWRAVLWYSEVERLHPGQIAPLLGLTANGVAALSYRAREGLRQAYLQEHLQSPPTPGCRRVADKLGAYVRGGLAKRESAQVQEHLDGCEDCRALLLELGDVNHGMRAVIAPLVLGVVGLGALAHPLPVTGGLLAGWAVSGGAGGAGATAGGATTGGATTSGAAAGSTAAGTGAAGTGAAGTVGATTAGSAAASTASVGAAAAAGTAAAGAAAGVASSGAVAGGGLLALLGGMSGGAIAAAVAGVVVVGGLVTASTLGVFSGPGSSDAASTPSAAPTESDGTVPSDSAGPSPQPTDLPADLPGDVVTVPSGDELASIARDAGVGTEDQQQDQPADQATDQPTDQPTTSPPTEEPVLTPADIQLAAAQTDLELVAGSEQDVSIYLVNAGQSPAYDLVAVLGLPAGVSVASVETALNLAGSQGRSVGSAGSVNEWSCSSDGVGSLTLTCRLGELPGGASVHLTVRVHVGRAAPGGTAGVDLTLTGTGVAPTRLSVPARVRALPAALTVVPPSDQELTATEPHDLAWTVTNSGGPTAGDVTVRLALPAGVAWSATQPAGDGWACDAEDDGTTLRCTVPALGVDGSATLHRSVVPTTEILAAPRVVIGYDVWWDSAAAAGTTAFTVVPSPGEIGLSGPAELDAVVGRPVSATWTVAHRGGPRLHDVALTVTLPAGLVLDDGAAGAVKGWSCAGSRTVTCSLATLDPKGSVPLTLVLRASSYDATQPTRTIQVDARRAGDLHAAAVTSTVTVHPVPATLTTRDVPPVSLVAGETTGVDVVIDNVGGTDARDVAAHVVLPDGVHAASASIDGADCAREPSVGPGDVWTCTSALLPVGSSSTLHLGLTADAGASGATGLVLTVDVSAPSAVAAATRSVPVDVSAAVLALGTPAPLAALSEGRTGTVSLTLQNTGDAVAHHAAVRLTLPSHLRLDTDLPDATPCTTTTGSGTVTVTCALGDVAPGAEVPVVVGVRASAGGSQDLLLTLTADGVPSLEHHLEARIASGGLAPRFVSASPSVVTEIGAPLLSCDVTQASCAKILAGTQQADNNGVAMVPLNTADGTLTSSSATLTVPVGSKVSFAGLYWSANAGPSQSFEGALTSARLRAPGAASYADVTGTVLAEVTDLSSRRYYQSFADVTAQVAAAGGGTWSVADVAMPTRHNDSDPTYYAGWALVVVYEPVANDVAGRAAAGDVSVYDGGSWVAAGQSVPFAFATGAAGSARLGVVAWDGDRGSTGDRLALNGVALTPSRWDPVSGTSSATGSAANAFDSTAVGSPYANSLGVDVKGFASAPLVDGVNTVVASSAGDQYLIGVVTLTRALGG